LDAFAVHGAAGIWGLLMAGFFATEEYTKQTYGVQHKDWGVFYGGNGTQLGAQLIAILVVPLWPTFWAVVVFGFFRLVDSKRYDNPLFIFMDYSTFETLTFGEKATVEPALDFKDPLAREMTELPRKSNLNSEDEDPEKGLAKGSLAATPITKRKSFDSDSGTATASSDEDRP